MLDMAIAFKMNAQGPEMLVRCLRVREFLHTPAFQLLAQGEFEQVKNLISIGQASVLDVHQGGWSLLHVGLHSLEIEFYNSYAILS